MKGNVTDTFSGLLFYVNVDDVDDVDDDECR